MYAFLTALYIIENILCMCNNLTQLKCDINVQKYLSKNKQGHYIMVLIKNKTEKVHNICYY